MRFTPGSIRDAIHTVLEREDISLWLDEGGIPHGRIHPEDIGHIAQWVIEYLQKDYS